MISKYLVAVVVLCLVGLLKSQKLTVSPPQSIESEMCPGDWKRVCPTVVEKKGVRYDVVNENGIRQCYTYKECRVPGKKCCVGSNICKQEYTLHPFVVHRKNSYVGVKISIPVSCNCLPKPPDF